MLLIEGNVQTPFIPGAPQRRARHCPGKRLPSMQEDALEKLTSGVTSLDEIQRVVLETTKRNDVIRVQRKYCALRFLPFLREIQVRRVQGRSIKFRTKQGVRKRSMKSTNRER